MLQIEARWDSLPASPDEPIFKRVDETHPLDFYLGRDIGGEPVLLLLSNSQPPVSHQYRSIHVLTRRRRDGRWALMFRLASPELRTVFSHLCEDLISSTRSTRDSAAGIATIMTRFGWWRRLFERGGSGLLDHQALRGLVAELLCLETFLLPSDGAASVVSAWVGPLGADQDFRFSDRLYEVKSAFPGSTCVRISSAEQLEPGERSLELVVVELDDVPPEHDAATFDTLQLTGRIRAKLVAVPDALQLFDERLLAAGFLNREEYASSAFTHVGTTRFAVAGDFPRVRRAALPLGVTRVSYDLTLDACRPFQIST